MRALCNRLMTRREGSEAYLALSMVLAPSEMTTGAGEIPSSASRITRREVLESSGNASLARRSSSLCLAAAACAIVDIRLMQSQKRSACKHGLSFHESTSPI